MPVFQVAVQIVPREGLLDPQGSAVAGALRTVGFPEVRAVHVGRFVVVETAADDAGQAGTAVRAMCEKLLANPVTEDFVVSEARPA